MDNINIEKYRDKLLSLGVGEENVDKILEDLSTYSKIIFDLLTSREKEMSK